MLLEFGEVVEGIDAVQLAGVDQAHKQISHTGAILGFIKIRVFPMENRFLECSFAEVVVQGGSGLLKEQRQLVPVREHVVDRLAQAAVRLDLSLLELLGEPSGQFIHPRAALLLMELEPLFNRQGRCAEIICMEAIYYQLAQTPYKHWKAGSDQQ